MLSDCYYVLTVILDGEKRMQKVFHEPAVLNWDRVIHKNARTKDGEPLGYIASEDRDFIVILSSGSREYKIPKPHVEAFDGAQVFLDLEFGEVSRFRIN